MPGIFFAINVYVSTFVGKFPTKKNLDGQNDFSNFIYREKCPLEQTSVYFFLAKIMGI
jgi:hypothetical protein